MTINAIRKLDHEWYEPERDDLDSEEAQLPGAEYSGFKIRPLTGSELMDVSDVQGLTGHQKSIMFAMSDWRNFADGEKFKLTSALKLIPAKYQVRIGKRILEISDYSGEQQKN